MHTRTIPILLLAVTAACGGSDGASLTGFPAVVGQWAADGYILSIVENPDAPQPIVVERAVVVFIEPDSSFVLSTTDTFNNSIEIAGTVFAADNTVFLVEGKLNAGAFDTATVAYARSGSQLGFAASGLEYDADGEPGLEPVVFDMVLTFAAPLAYPARLPVGP